MHDRCLDEIAETATSSDIRLIPPFNADKSDTRATEAFFHHKAVLRSAEAVQAQYCRSYITWSKRRRHIYPLVTD